MEPAAGHRVCSGVTIDYRSLFGAVPGLYLLLDSGFVIRDMSDAYARATLIDKAAALDRPIFEVFPDNPDDPSADGVRKLHASLKLVMELGLPDSMGTQKYDIRQPDGSFVERYWNPVNVPLPGANGEVAFIIHTVEDITELVRMNVKNAAQEQAAREQLRIIGEMRTLNQMLSMTLSENRKLEADRAYLADIVASSNDAIIARTSAGKIASWNRAAELMYGYGADEVIGRPVGMLAPPQTGLESEELAARLERGEPVNQYETVRRRRDGTEFPVSITASLVRNAAGQISGTSAIVRDITERREAEARMRALQDELIHLSRWNTMGMMASTLAHELNQPLTAMMNFVRAARRTLAKQDAPETLRTITLLDKAVEETRLAGGIIRSMRDFIAKRETSRSPENINAVVEEAIGLSLLGAAQARIETRIELDPLLPPVVIDKIQIEQVLLNLIRNAMEAMQDAPQSRLLIATGADEPGFVGVSVSDTGPGLSPEIARNLFQPFMTTKEKGMGIGLTICQSIIEAHGGSIGASALEPRGVCFRFRLPVEARGHD